jgi:Uma2 family endonuclease
MAIANEQPIEMKEDQLLRLQGGWEQFELIRRGCEQNHGLRLSYFEGSIELFVPGSQHARIAHGIGVFLTGFLAHQGVLFFGTGAVEQRRENVASLQADQSYCLGTLKAVADLAIEVISTGCGIDRLARYQAIGVLEVWLWEAGALGLYRLRGERYEGIDCSELEGLMDLDLGVLARHVVMAEADLGAAVRSFMAYVVEVDGMDLTEEQVVELKRRSRAFDENPEEVMTWEEVRGAILLRSYAARVDEAAFDEVMRRVPDVEPMVGDEL